MTESSIVLLGCGDVGPMHEPVDAYSTLVRSTLASGDLRFAQVERVYSQGGALHANANDEHSRLKPHMASVFTDCGFDVVSFASNHAMDFGETALLDSIALFKKLGIKTIGAGRNLEEARQPAIIKKNGVTVAFLAYCSVMREGYEANAKRGGVAPLRAHTRYEPIDHQAGVPPRVITTPYEDDLAAMVDDIQAAKKAADVVVLSLHWGVHLVPRLIADYQTIAATAAFNAGASVILGHHAHAPKAIGVHQGKVCFYSLSNFIMSAQPKNPAKAAAFERNYQITMDPDYPNLPYGTDGKRSLIARILLTKGGAQKVSFLPVLIDKQLRPEVLHSGDARFDDAVRFMSWLSEGFGSKLTPQADEVLVSAA